MDFNFNLNKLKNESFMKKKNVVVRYLLVVDRCFLLLLGGI